MNHVTRCCVLMFCCVWLSLPARGGAAERGSPTSLPSLLPRCICDGGGWELRDGRTGEVMLSRLELAVSLRARIRGLQGRPRLPADAGMLLVPANAIHTRRMGFAIDLFYLDGCGRVIAIRRNVCPWRRARRVRGTHAVLETTAGASDIRLGQRLHVVRKEEA
ncbi:MAG: DUF192 domain-containing protein [Pirellulaceae bacterium]